MKQTPISESSAHLDLQTSLPVIEESTTSRVLVDNPLLRTVEFTFDAGQLLTTHSSPRAVVVQLVEGEMSFTIDDQTHHMRGGDVLYMAPGAQHSLVADTACRMTLVMVVPPAPDAA